MERIYEELDDLKDENEKLRADCKNKSKLCENLKQAHNELLNKIQEANLKVEKQAQELNEKTEEVSEVKQLLEDLNRSLIEKESIVRRLSAANDKLRFDCDEKCRNWEEQNRQLVMALDEANEKNIDQEQKINVFMAETEGLKGLLSASQKKCLEAEREAKAPKKLRERDDMLLKLEDDNRKFEDQLKWKKEQFKHLEEAHEKLKDQFRTKSQEIFRTGCKSATKLLLMKKSCRKYLEVQVSEFRTHYENTFADYQDAKSQLECLTNQRDKEIAALRHSLGTKETFYKEMEYQAAKLEKENQELLMSLKELQEAQIQKAGSSSSLVKLRNKLRSVEQMHRDCSANLRAKEAEWSSQLEKMDAELNDYRSELERKDASIEELKMELEGSNSLALQLKMQNEEFSVMLVLLKAGLSDAQLKLVHVEGKRDIHSKEREEHVSLLMQQLEMKTAALAEAHTDIEVERQRTASLLRRIESFDHIEEHGLLMQKELDRYKEVLEESSKCQLSLKEQALQTESDYKKKLEEVCDVLDTANLELAKEREKAASLPRVVESLENVEAQRVLMQKELEKYKEMLEESSRCEHHLEEQAKQMESDSERNLKEVSDALDIANLELAKEREKAASLSRVVESSDHSEKQQVLMQKELEKYKEMLEEASRCQHILEEQAKQVDSDSQRKLKEVSDALDIANLELAKEREKAASLSRVVESSDHSEKQQGLMQKELQKYKEMLEEASRCQHHLEEQAKQMESDSERKVKEVCDALDILTLNWRKKTSEGHQIEFELWIWKSIAENLKVEFEECQGLRKELEASLLAQVEVGEIVKQENRGLICTLEEKDSRISNFQKQVLLLEQVLKAKELEAAASNARMESTLSFQAEKQMLQITREKDKILEDLQREIGWLEQESLRRELETALITQIGAEQSFEHEKENIIQLVEEKGQKIEDLLQLARSLEHNYNSSLNTFSSQLAEKQGEINLALEAWEKISAAETLAMLEIEEKKLMIVELEDEISSIQQKLELQEKSLSHSKQHAQEIETELEVKQKEMRTLIDQLEANLRTSDSCIDELRSENQILLEDVLRSSSERENLFGLLRWLSDSISKFSDEDMQLMEILERIVQSFDNKKSDLVWKSEGELLDSVKENMNAHPSPTIKKFETVLEERSPFKQLN
ncbi:basic helix-loop-helix (bHLH) DNA-binding superfamily protein [Melia azedarach]|uniref:Basic helix-loop-helix (BHLH) DNA-binding superfamily protein n=1 Tax=Melia azedarach TaxID=155640 RepID=A0ACC1XW81_MELAZ|nr:basic helix-loop-helix (bHLH) DNA-binding superfamily protein [Melia azedarach]